MPAKFEASALFELLGRVDRELAAPSIIFLIGGSAVSIIDPAHSTSDVDLLSPGSVEFDAAVARLGARGEPVLPKSTGYLSIYQRTVQPMSTGAVLVKNDGS